MTPIHLGLVVDPEGGDRPGDRSVDIDDSLHDARVSTNAGPADKKGVTIGRIVGGEGGHADRLRILHLLIDRIEIGVHERS